MMLDPKQGLGKKVRDVVPSRDMLNAELLALDVVLQCRLRKSFVRGEASGLRQVEAPPLKWRALV